MPYCSQCLQQVHSVLFTISAGQQMAHIRLTETNLKPASCGSCCDACCCKVGMLADLLRVCACLQVTTGLVRLKTCLVTSVRRQGRRGAKATRAPSLQEASPGPNLPRYQHRPQGTLNVAEHECNAGLCTIWLILLPICRRQVRVACKVWHCLCVSTHHWKDISSAFAGL